MNLSMWTAMREYIAAEIKLGILRSQRESGNAVCLEEISKQEAQSTRMETAVREHVAALEKEAVRTRQTNLMNTRFR
jgi:hypothetical protein